MDDDSVIASITSSIADASVISILFPALRRSLVIDARSDEEHDPIVLVMPQVTTFEERIRRIEKLRPRLGKVRAILGVPWMRSLRELEDARIPDGLVQRLVAAGVTPADALEQVTASLRQLKRYEQLSFTRLVKGQGFANLWPSNK
jgi:hypothetical protein